MPFSTGMRSIEEASENRPSQRPLADCDCPCGIHPTGCHGVLGLRGGLGRCTASASPADIEPYVGISLVPPTSVDGYHGLHTFHAFSWLQRMSVGSVQRFSRSRLAPGDSEGKRRSSTIRDASDGKWALRSPTVDVAI